MGLVISNTAIPERSKTLGDRNWYGDIISPGRTFSQEALQLLEVSRISTINKLNTFSEFNLTMIPIMRLGYQSIVVPNPSNQH